MLVFTNRHTTNATGPAAFDTHFTPRATALSCADVARAPGAGFAVQSLQSGLSDDAALHTLVPLFAGPTPLLVYLHGNNNSPAACFERCARLEEIYGVAAIGFSWPSEGLQADGSEPAAQPNGADVSGGENELATVTAGNAGQGGIQRKIRRYQQAKLNAQDGIEALARFLRLVATARLYANQQPVTLAAHSLGAHFLQYTIDVNGAAESLGAMHHVALLAACCRASGHADWLARLHPRDRVFVTYNRDDLVLFGAYIADRNQLKLGADPGPKLSSPKVRYISFTNAQNGFGGHGYFVRDAGSDVPAKPKKLFGRIFSSQADLQGSEIGNPRKVYPLGCDADGLTCYMANPQPAGEGG